MIEKAEACVECVNLAFTDIFSTSLGRASIETSGHGGVVREYVPESTYLGEVTRLKKKRLNAYVVVQWR